MKKLINIFFLIAAVSFFIACSDDDDDKNQGFEVVKVEDTNFEVLGGTATVTLSENVATAVSDNEDWCKVTNISGNTVTVQTTINPAIESRNAVITVTSANGEEAIVRINQLGFVFDLSSLDDISSTERLYINGGKREILVNTNTPIIEVRTDASWLDVSISGDTVTIDYPSTGVYRDAKLEFTFRDNNNNIINTRTTTLVQNVYAYNDLIGNWTLSYTNSDGRTQRANVSLSRLERGVSYTVTNVPVGSTTVSFEVNYSSGDLIIRNAQYLGPYNRNYLYLFPITVDGSFYPFNGSVQYAGEASPDFSNIQFIFGDNGTSLGSEIDGLIYALFTTEEVSEETYTGDAGIQMNWVLTKN